MSFTGVNQEISNSNMIDMQSSGLAKTAPPGNWYCPECGFGPLNSELDVGCPNCGTMRVRAREVSQLYTSNQSSLSCSLVPAVCGASPVAIPIALQTNSQHWMPESEVFQQYLKTSSHDFHDGFKALNNASNLY